jgi:non-ribosomal peptide synthase protein (TIGR01720 family)
VGWFTSIFPVQVDLAHLRFASQPGAALRFVKEQLGKIPRRGIGYGMLRYLAGRPELLKNPDPPVVFNYLGQFDQVIANSELFRPAGDFFGLWHSPRQRRRHALEVNCLVVGGRLNVRWTYNPELTSESSLQALGNEFIHALRLLISDCLQRRPGERTSDDFPLVHLGAAVLKGLLAGHPQLEDLYPLSPVQALYFSANPTRMLTGFDQWHCSLSGPLDVPAFQNAWRQTINRHSVLRSSVQIDGLQEPLQMVAKQVDLPWTVEDWSALPTESTDRAWLEFLSRDRARPLDLTKAPVMRFALIRQAENRWNFLWSLPALFLDGWSWPIVFKDASRIYESFRGNTEPNLQPAPPYRNYLQWLRQQSLESSKQFWREMLSDFAAPTALPTEPQTVAETAGRFASFQVPVRPQTAVGLQAAARRLHLTLNSLVQGAWALLLARQSKSSSVVFGSAFSGRPANLESSEFIVGPFVNVLPVRADIKPLDPAADFFRQLHTRLLGLNLHQFAPLSEVQRYSKVPERLRLFDSLIVFQNYRIDGASEAFGGQLQISDFVGPVHTNYPLLLLVEPHAGLRLTMIYDMRLFTRATVERWAQDIANLLDNLVSGLDQSVSALLDLLSVPAMTAHHPARQLGKPRQNLVPAQSPNERAIAAIWAEMFGLDHVSVEETFFDLGGHSLLLVRMHRRLQEAGWPDLSIVTLFEHPTVRALARHLDRAGEPSPALASGDSRNRAVQQKNALQQMRARLKKSD